MDDRKKTLRLSGKQIRKSGTVSKQELENVEVKRMEARLRKQVDEWQQKRRSRRF